METNVSQEIVQSIIDFVRSIGIKVEVREVPSEKQFLPGICIEKSNLLIDIDNLKYPGDILHEAAHLAVADPLKRSSMDGVIGSDTDEDRGEEMMAIAWSYAAAIHLNIDPHMVFHEHGYKGGGESIVQAFSSGNSFGVPLLQWVGLTYDEKNAKEKNEKAFPHMIKWIRE